MKKVLVIDQDADARSQITEMLSELHYTVFAVGNTKDALPFLDRNPQIVFLDQQTTQPELTSVLKTVHDRIPSAQCVLICAESSSVETALLDINHVVSKPFMTAQFLSTLDKCMRSLVSPETRRNPVAQSDFELGAPSNPSALSLLAVLLPAYTDEIAKSVGGSGWNLKSISAVSEMPLHDPLTVGCILLDSTHKPLVDDVLAWCEQAKDWQSVPKLLITPRALAFKNLVSIPWESVQRHLESYLETARNDASKEDAPERRKHYRHKCEWMLNINQASKLLDLSAGGASIELPFAIPKGTRLRIPISDSDPLLRAVDADVITSRWRAASKYSVHLRFTDISVARERALQRLILALQIH